ncbi:MAG: HDOD domain-containing protein [Phycisphaeraceae bacterium]|nr:HDOD domain-containing protein [Phycisphaeraceae bacterium]MCB9847513.1 HDOD domain-containing protein [Phycisphaeraceae bacterium]
MPALLEKVITCPSLPSLPAVAIEVLELTRDPNVSIKEIAKVVENDQAIASKVLRTINSSYYGLSSPCPTIQRAMGYLGLNTVRSLVLGFSLVDSFRSGADESGFDLQRHWRRALYGASGARSTANRACSTDPDEAFIASMLQDVGMLAASMALGDDYNEAILEADGDHYAVEGIERERFGFTHCEAGAALAERWRLPRSMIEVVRHHHHPQGAAPEHRDLVQTVALSTLAAESLTVSKPAPLIQKFKRLGSEWFELPVDRADELLKSIADGAGELSRLFQLDTGHKPDVAGILSQAQEQQIEMQISIERERQSLESTATELEKQNLTDGLTGVANRKRFDQEFKRAFDAAMNGGALAVIFMDADRFKRVNDDHGHQAGDAVLVELARRATEAVGAEGLLCRYGGEEFAVIASGANRVAGARIGEAIRKAIEAAPFDLRDVPECPDELPVTVSLGVAAIDVDSQHAYAGADALLKAADTAVYAAKRCGRNCTRVYNPSKAARTTLFQSQAGPRGQHGSGSGEAHGSPVVKSPVVIAKPEGRKPCLLLVEDDPMHRGLMLTALANYEHVDAIAVTCAEEALNMLGICAGECAGSGLIPDIILIDYTLPGVTGIELIEQIRDSPRHKEIPAIMLSANEDRATASQCIRAGANAFLPKSRMAQDPIAIIGHLVGFWTSLRLAA